MCSLMNSIKKKYQYYTNSEKIEEKKALPTSSGKQSTGNKAKQGHYKKTKLDSQRSKSH